VPADKDAAKRRRQARNRQERLQRQKRIEGAKRSAARPAPATGGPKADAGAGSPVSSSGGLLGRLFPPRQAPPTAEGTDGRPSRAQPTRPARPTRSVPVQIDDAGGIKGFLQRSQVQPGGRPTLLALLLSIVSAVTLLAFPVIPQLVLEGYGLTVVEASPVGDEALAGRVERFEDGDPVTEMVRAFDTDNPVAIVIFALVPVAISVIAARSLTSPTRSRTLLISAMVAAVYTFLTGAIGVYFFLGVICLGWASFQSRKADAMVAAAEG
jgi:hypothetical protein